MVAHVDSFHHGGKKQLGRGLFRFGVSLSRKRGKGDDSYMKTFLGLLQNDMLKASLMIVISSCGVKSRNMVG